MPHPSLKMPTEPTGVSKNSPGSGAHAREGDSNQVIFHHDKIDDEKLDVVLPANEALIAPTVRRIMEVVSDIECSKGKDYEDRRRHSWKRLPMRFVMARKTTANRRRFSASLFAKSQQGMRSVVRYPGTGFDPQRCLIRPKATRSLMTTGVEFT